MTSFWLHILAMTSMVLDHLGATLFPAQEWLGCVGRLAFPIFAFMIVEGYFHTSDVKRYLTRILIFAVISEIPFNLIFGSSVSYPYHQNVLWTFALGLISIIAIEKAKETFWQRGKKVLFVCISILVVAAGFTVGTALMVDYYGVGVLMVLTFYFFHGRKWWCFAGQLVLMYVLNVVMLGGYYYVFEIGGISFEVVQQGLAMLSLIPIWLYRGRQGYHAKWFQYLCYGFYPGHLLLLYVIWQWSL